MQILFMVGSGFLRPDLKKLKAETPKCMKPVIEHCIKKKREERPLFPEVYALQDFWGFGDFNLVPPCKTLGCDHDSETIPVICKEQ